MAGDKLNSTKYLRLYQGFVNDLDDEFEYRRSILTRHEWYQRVGVFTKALLKLQSEGVLDDKSTPESSRAKAEDNSGPIDGDGNPCTLGICEKSQG